MEQVVLLLTRYGYLALFPIAAFEGPVVSLLVGFFIRLGYFNFFPAYVILIFGDLIPDTIYYYIGRFGNKKKLIEKYGTRYNFISGNFQLIEKLWREHGRKTMFLSKLAYGLSTPFLISAGLVNISFRKFVSCALPITIFQYAALMLVGYYLGSSYQFASTYIHFAEIIIALFFVIFIAGYILFAKYAYRQIIKMEK